MKVVRISVQSYRPPFYHFRERNCLKLKLDKRKTEERCRFWERERMYQQPWAPVSSRPWSPHLPVARKTICSLYCLSQPELQNSHLQLRVSQLTQRKKVKNQSTRLCIPTLLVLVLSWGKKGSSSPFSHLKVTSQLSACLPLPLFNIHTQSKVKGRPGPVVGIPSDGVTSQLNQLLILSLSPLRILP